MTQTTQRLRIAYFGHNRKDTAFLRRVRGFLQAGVTITTFTYRRDGEPESPGPAWSNVDLGHVEHGRFFQRAWLYLRAIRAVFGQRATLQAADVIYARNLDVFLFAWLTVRLSTFGRRRRAAFIYECLDVHEALLGNSVKARILRALERRVLDRSCLLVASSPGFIDHYFVPQQSYDGPWHWVENKLYFDQTSVARPSAHASSKDRCLTVGWVGIIRCQKTLDLLTALAKAFPGKVRIKVSGLVSYFLLPNFDEIVADTPNMEFAGPYDWPTGLAKAYDDIDLVWSQELSWSGGNSDWLIPNRVYEASYFGVPSLAINGTQTGQIVAERDIGFVLDEATAETLIQFVDTLERESIRAARERLLAQPSANFVLQSEDTDKLLGAIFNAIERPSNAAT